MILMRYVAIAIALFGMLSAMSLSEVNQASKDELMRIKGVGEAKANAIMSARPFKSMQELDDVKGVGDVLLANIKSDTYKKSPTSSSASKAKIENYEDVEDEPKRKKVNVIHFEK